MLGLDANGNAKDLTGKPSSFFSPRSLSILCLSPLQAQRCQDLRASWVADPGPEVFAIDASMFLAIFQTGLILKAYNNCLAWIGLEEQPHKQPLPCIGVKCFSRLDDQAKIRYKYSSVSSLLETCSIQLNIQTKIQSTLVSIRSLAHIHSLWLKCLRSRLRLAR